MINYTISTPGTPSLPYHRPSTSLQHTHTSPTQLPLSLTTSLSTSFQHTHTSPTQLPLSLTTSLSTSLQHTHTSPTQLPLSLTTSLSTSLQYTHTHPTQLLSYLGLPRAEKTRSWATLQAWDRLCAGGH